MGKRHIEDLLSSSEAFVGSPRTLKQWPGKEQQQHLAALWLSVWFLPGRLYSESEVDWIICRHHASTRIPDYPLIRKELERRGFATRIPGGKGLYVLEEIVDSALKSIFSSAD